MRTSTITLNNKPYDILVASNAYDIAKGMSIYNDPPSNGILFELRGLYTTFTMKNVKFPLYVLLYNNNKRLMSDFTAYPGDPDQNLLYGIWYMIEIPLKQINLNY